MHQTHTSYAKIAVDYLVKVSYSVSMMMKKERDTTMKRKSHNLEGKTVKAVYDFGLHSPNVMPVEGVVTESRYVNYEGARHYVTLNTPVVVRGHVRNTVILNDPDITEVIWR